MTTFRNEKGYRPIDFHCGGPKPDDNWPYHNHPTTPHDSEFGIKNPKFERHIFIMRDQILYDVDAQIQMVTSARRSQDGAEDATLQQATERFKPMFNRWIDTHIGIAKVKISAFVLEKFKDTETNALKNTDEVDITLLMPEWYDDTTFHQLTSSVHNYIVSAVLCEYFALSLTQKDPVMIAKMEEREKCLAEIKTLVNASKPGRIRKIQKPF